MTNRNYNIIFEFLNKKLIEIEKKITKLKLKFII
jgi:hypothetical protein